MRRATEPYDRSGPRGSYDRIGKINKVIDSLSERGVASRTNILMEMSGLTRTNIQAILTSLVGEGYVNREYRGVPGKRPIFFYSLTAAGHSQSVKHHDDRDWNKLYERRRKSTEDRKARAKELGRSLSNFVYAENQAAKEKHITDFSRKAFLFLQITITRGSTTNERKLRQEWWANQP